MLIENLGEFLLLIAIGFCAQLVDGALGMAFGVISTSAMLTMGLPPAHASAIVHTAEVFTTAASGASHIYHRNVDWRLVGRLGMAGVLGAVLGAWVLSNIDASVARPIVAAYLGVMGAFILVKAARRIPERDASFRYAPPLGFIGGFLDADISRCHRQRRVGARGSIDPYWIRSRSPDSSWVRQRHGIFCNGRRCNNVLCRTGRGSEKGAACAGFRWRRRRTARRVCG